MAQKGNARTLQTAASAVPALTGEGNPHSKLLFIHDAGTLNSASRALLGKMIEAMGLTNDQIYLCDVTCFIQHSELSPTLIVTLGQPATQAILNNQTPIKLQRGRFAPLGAARVLPTFDPAYLLSHPESKREAWSDLQAIARELGLIIPGKKG